ncbi:(S)-limonene 6-monooxygenase [uncultured Roseburia sp.]|uniref:Sigma 54-interacting transcriptional regulator n=1 Tax=Brotonthovivens ammoniilytica TaxID=2981725 RepID=A0ABT2TI56_9FIRM|nr:sigma 54-interacting transcriptional regulator [Brotonthovivens ammoniilytica]MCU6761885.1 sigma 54-interacting transcriptional regulator [Brotonthovivens ammoniilytica]SCI49589.1 (S)-limonene 6-monooxygenase [uncultured Roseburia sp.]
MEHELYLEKLKSSINILSDILDTENYGMCIVDRQGRIVVWNYERFFHLRASEVLGKPVTEVLENTRLHIVAKTGKKELFQLQKINGTNVIANRIPILYHGEIIGAAGTIIFKDTRELGELYSRIEKVENSFKAYRSEIAQMYRAKYTFNDIHTENDKMISLKEFCQVVAQSDASILIRGESGTGKELFAQAIHNGGASASYPFISIDCAAIPKKQLEAELFGYEGTLFNGGETKIGKLELADQGTVFLDELGSMSLDMQAKLLRVLETREFEKSGSNKKTVFKARVIAATNEDLEKAIEEKRFRRDLYYRINVIPVQIPPLRERMNDLPRLCRVLIPHSRYGYSRKNLNVADSTMKILFQHSWPGNVRELRNVLERAAIVCSSQEILPEHLPEYLQKYNSGPANADGKSAYRQEIENLERRLIQNALQNNHGNKMEAARQLGIQRSLLYKKISDLDIKTDYSK